MTAAWQSSTLILAAHGSHRNAAACDVVRNHARTIADQKLFSEVKAAFWHGDPALSEVLQKNTTEVTYVVPIFKSEGHFTKTVVPREMNLSGEVTEFQNHGCSRLVHLCAPVGTHPEIPDLAAEVAETTAENCGFEFSKTSVILVGHGGKESRASEQATLRVAYLMKQQGKFASVAALFLEQVPLLQSWSRSTEENVVAVPFLIGGGGHEVEISTRLGLKQSDGIGMISGVRFALSQALGESEQIPRLILDLVSARDQMYKNNDNVE